MQPKETFHWTVSLLISHFLTWGFWSRLAFQPLETRLTESKLLSRSHPSLACLQDGDKPSTKINSWTEQRSLCTRWRVQRTSSETRASKFIPLLFGLSHWTMASVLRSTSPLNAVGQWPTMCCTWPLIFDKVDSRVCYCTAALFSVSKIAFYFLFHVLHTNSSHFSRTYEHK